MKDLATVGYHPKSEAVVKVLCEKTQNSNPHFFRLQVAYNFAKVASMMRASIKDVTGERIPINQYVINLALSGQGKGHSTNILEEKVINQFRQRFIDETHITLAEQNIAQLAAYRAQRDGADPDKTLEDVSREFAAYGPMVFSFSEATTPAIKQLRQRLLMANSGSINLEIDEIGTNLSGSLEALGVYLELYDVGKVKPKLIKHTRESLRGEELHGKTPANLLMFGTPNRVLDGGKTEDEFMQLMNTGYARRCLFGLSRANDRKADISAAQYLQMVNAGTSDAVLHQISDELFLRADISNFGLCFAMPDPVQLLLIEYKLDCEKRAQEFPEHEEIRAAEMAHRYFKAMKQAGTYAFIDGTTEITEDQMYWAIKLVEDSGEAFYRMTQKEHQHVKLAKYIASHREPLTVAQLVEELPFFPKANAAQNDMLRLSQSWGYKHKVLIKREFEDGLEFISGETMEETDLGKMFLSWSTDITEGYQSDVAPFNQLENLTQQSGLHWTTHRFAGGYRDSKNAIPGFNLLVLDVDDGTSVDTVRLLLKDYTYHIYTTKRHQTPGYGDRFRVILPLNYVVKLDAEDHKQFMENVFAWLPFEVDTAAKDIARKWMTHTGQWWYNEGEMVNALKFIPKTAESEKQQKQLLDNRSLTNMERWFIQNTVTGNRSNQMIKYAFVLVDQGLPFDHIKNAVLALNSKLASKMDEAEILSTVMVSVGKRMSDKATKGP